MDNRYETGTTLPDDNNFYSCGLHFQESDFKRDLQHELVPGSKRKYQLNEDAVPYTFTFSEPKKCHRRLNTLEESRARQSILGPILDADKDPGPSNKNLRRSECLVDIDPNPISIAVPNLLRKVTTIYHFMKH